MVSTVISSWSIDGLGSLSDKCDDKSDSETCFGFEDNFNIVKPLIISNGHISIPHFLQHSHETKDILDIFEDTNKDLKHDNSEEIFTTHINKNIKADLERKNVVEKALERYDDPHAKLSVSKTQTTQCPPHTPKYIIFSPSTTPGSVKWKYVTFEERKTMNETAIEGQKDFCKELIKKGIDPEKYVSPIFNSNKKNGSTKKFYFDCSTPKTKTLSDLLSTPFEDRSNLNTPISGIKKLTCFSGDTTTPNFLTSYHSDISFNETFSPVRDLPQEIKSTLLSGK